MRIAFFHNLPAGGAKRSAHEWIKRMTRDHTVDLYLYDPAAEDYLDLQPFVRQTILIPGGETALVRRPGLLASFSRWLKLLTSLPRVQRASARVARQINHGGYDLAFVMQCQVSNSPFVLRDLRIPSLYFCHEPYTKVLEPHFRANDGRLGPAKRMFIHWMAHNDRANARRATVICANSLYSRETIYRAYGVYPRLTRMGVDTAQFRPLGLECEGYILSVGALSPLKAQDFIVQSVGTLKERPPIRFIHNTAIGDYQARLVQLAEQLGVSVSFDRLVTEDALVTAYNQAALTAFPSHLEPFGLIPIESLACGTPVVGVAEGGIRETVQHGETGLLTERDPMEYGQAIEVLMKDETLRTRMGARGRQQVVEHWTWDASYRQLEKNMQRAVADFR